MNVKDLSNLIIRLFGLYLLVQAILVGLTPVLNSLTYRRSGEWSASFAAAGFGLAMTLLLVVLGVLMVVYSNVLTAWLLRGSGAPEKPLIQGMAVSGDFVAGLLYSLLGLFLLVQTLPPAVFAFSSWLQEQFWSDNMLRAMEMGNPDRYKRLPTLLFHVTAVGLSAAILLKGRSLHVFLHSLSKVRA